MLTIKKWKRGPFSIHLCDFDYGLKQFVIISNETIAHIITPPSVDYMHVMIEELDNNESLLWEDDQGNIFYIKEGEYK